jgi:hypothetical protein
VAEEFDGDPSPVAGAITRRIIHQHPEVLAKYGPAVVGQAIDDVADFVGDADEIGSSDVSGWVRQVIQSLEKSINEGDNLATFESTLDTMRKAAGVPIFKAALLSAGGAAYDKFTESRLMDSAGETLQHILNRFKHEVKNFEENSDLDDDLYDALYDYYSNNGEMPYGTMKARTGDPYNWISDRLAQELGVNENLISPMAMPVTTEGAGCNMTMEGEYCPEHGLMECGGMYENMDEEKVDEFIDPDTITHAINALNPVTGALAGAAIGKGIEKTIGYFQKKKQDKAYDNLKQQRQQMKVAEGGDVLLARIKSLALLK